MPSKGKDTFFIAAGALLLLILWQILASFAGTGFLLPSPGRVVLTFVNLFSKADGWLSVLRSAGRILRSVLVATALAILAAWFASRHRPLRLLLSPLILVMKSVPIVSFILVALFFMGESLLTSFICGLIVFPLNYGQLLSALSDLDPGLLEMGRVFSLKKGELIRYLVVPGCREVFLASTSVAVGMAWKAGVAAEVLAFAPGTIGRHMHEAKLYLDMEKLLAWTLALVLVSFLTEQVLIRLFRFLLTHIGQSLRSFDLSRLLKKGRQEEKALKTRAELLREGRSAVEEAPVCPADGQAIRLSGVLSIHTASPGEDPPAIEIVQVSKCFGSSYVFSDYDARLPLDKPLVITGPSGIGKTTLMRLIAGLIRPDSGRIEGVPERGVFVFQENRLLPQLSARDNIRLVLPDYEEGRADQLLEALDLLTVKDQPASTLSGGEKRRLALARALAPESDILYLDEAFRELDQAHESQAIKLLLETAKGKPILIATHDLSLIDRLKANVLELRKSGAVR